MMIQNLGLIDIGMETELYKHNQVGPKKSRKQSIAIWLESHKSIICNMEKNEKLKSSSVFI